MQEGIENIPKEVPAFQNRITVYGKYHVHKRQKGVCEAFEKQIGGYSKARTSYSNKGCRHFVGMVNFVSIFCLELQKLLKPIYDLMGKGRQFVWGDKQHAAFDEIKGR